MVNSRRRSRKQSRKASRRKSASRRRNGGGFFRRTILGKHKVGDTVEYQNKVYRVISVSPDGKTYQILKYDNFDRSEYERAITVPKSQLKANYTFWGGPYSKLRELRQPEKDRIQKIIAAYHQT